MGRKIESRSDSLSKSPKNSEQDGLTSQLGIHTADDARLIGVIGEVNERMSAEVCGQLLFYGQQNNDQPVYIIVSTYGGSVDEMFGIYDVMKFIQKRLMIYTFGFGKIMSAGVLLLAAGSKGHRFLGNNARVMVHGLKSTSFGDIRELANEGDEIKRMQQQYCKVLASATNLSESEVEELLMSRRLDEYVSPSRAVELGIVDKLCGE